MEKEIKYVEYYGDKRKLKDVKYYCPNCSKRTVFEIEDTDDYYVDECFFCLECEHIFHLPGGTSKCDYVKKQIKMKEEYITKFKDYRDLPFSEEIQDELFKRHTHAELVENPEAIVYEEEDVLILLQMIQKDIDSILDLFEFVELTNEYDIIEYTKIYDKYKNK